MRIVVNIDSRLITDPRVLALLARGFLRGVVANNRLLMRTYARKYPGKRLPHLLHSGVTFRPEPWQGKMEEFADCLTVLERGWGDCDDLVAYRVAELNENAARGMPVAPLYGIGGDAGADITIYGKRNPITGEWTMHAEARRSSGEIEDVSRLLAGNPLRARAG